MYQTCLHPFRRALVSFTWGRPSKLPGRVRANRYSTASTPSCPPTREIRTLRADKLLSVAQPVMDLSHIKYCALKVTCKTLPEAFEAPAINFQYHGAGAAPFPTGTRGVFYFHHLQGDGMQSQIRFRLCNSIAEFFNGKDLQYPDGSLWHRTLRAMARYPDRKYARVLALLRAEFSIDVDPSLAAHRPISTLDPTKLPSSSQAVTDISGLWPALRFDGGSTIPEFDNARGGSTMPFPGNTVGVFYYKQSRTAPTRLGELRFRLCRDVRHFVQGEDLCLPSGTPWCISSLYIYAASRYQHLRSHLIEEGLLDETIYPGVLPNPPGTRIMPLRSLGDPFVVDLSAVASQVSILSDAHATAPTMTFRHIFRASLRNKPTFTGRAIVRLEEYPESPPITNSSTSLDFALRVLEFLTPVNRISDNDRIQWPEEGQLLMDRRKTQSVYKPRRVHPFPATSRPLFAEWVARTQGKVSDQQ